MSEGDRGQSRDRHPSHEAVQRAPTDDKAQDRELDRGPLAGKISSAELLLRNGEWSSGLARTRLERVADTLDVARRQLASVETAMAAGEPAAKEGILRLVGPEGGS